MADDRPDVVSIVNYAPSPRTDRMTRAFLDSVVAAGAGRVTLLYLDHEPRIAPELRHKIDVDIIQGKSVDVGHPHFNLRFKLPNLAAIDRPFLFIDADTYVTGDLRELWALRRDKPWIGIDHQWVPRDERTHRPAFLNSGVQLVGDPGFYDLGAILAVQTAAAPLAEADFTAREDFKTFLCPGADQAVLFRYFRATGYDYTHPKAGPGWNHCAGVTEVFRANNAWQARSTGMAPDYPVQIVHYWDQYKPWRIGDPIYASYEERGN